MRILVAVLLILSIFLFGLFMKSDYTTYDTIGPEVNGFKEHACYQINKNNGLDTSKPIILRISRHKGKDFEYQFFYAYLCGWHSYSYSEHEYREMYTEVSCPDTVWHTHK